MSCFSYTSCGEGEHDTAEPTPSQTPGPWEPLDSFYCGSSFEDAAASCEYWCPVESRDCPTGLACFKYTTWVDRCRRVDLPVLLYASD